MKLVMAIIKPFTLGRIGSRTIFIPDLESAARVRAGENDAAAI
jgi:nitrogen regulatory protein PII